MREAIAYAAPGLDPDDPAAARAVRGYVARMSGRPAPFGLFAGTTAGTVTGEPRYELAGLAALRRRDRPDIGSLDPEPDPVVPNSTLHLTGDRLRFVEREGGRYHPVAVEPDEFLVATLDRARGSATRAELAAALAGTDITLDEAAAYVDDLVGAQVLVPAGPPVTGDQPTGTGHTDTSRRAVALTLGDRVLAEALRAVEVLHPLARPTAVDADLAAFKEAFTARYGDAEVPLLEALDDETGIGFGAPTALAAAGAPLLAGLDPTPPLDGPPWTPIDHHLVDLLSRALRTGAYELELDAADLGPLREREIRPLPDAFAVIGTDRKSVV